MDISILFAVFRRLTGYPLDSKSLPLCDPTTGMPLNIDGKFGLRIPLPKSRINVPVDLRSPDGLRLWSRGFHENQFIQVPVFMGGIDARNWSDIPIACSFTSSDITSGEDPHYSPDDGLDGIRRSDTPETIVNSVTGVSQTVDSKIYTYPHPRPYNYWITISLYARDLVSMTLLERSLLNLFPSSDSIAVELSNGEIVRRNFFLERYAVMDQGEPYDPSQGLIRSVAAFFKRAFTFRFQTWIDTFTPGKFDSPSEKEQQTVNETLLELCDQGDRLLKTMNLEVE